MTQTTRRTAVLFFYTLAWVLAPGTPVVDAAAPAGKGDAEWVRLQRDDEQKPLSLQTAIGRYEGGPPGGGDAVLVDLVGALHMGEESYYRQLNRKFREYDAVLYELIAPPGAEVRINQGAANDNPLSAVQNGMRTMLGLEHQLDRINYKRRNFVHADMTPEQLFESVVNHEESFLKTYFRMQGQLIAQQSQQLASGKLVEIDMIKAVLADDRERQLKIVTAEQMMQSLSVLDGMGGEQGSTLIHERNQIALEVLDRELRRGKKKVAIFYGAGHLADMDERLREDFNLRQTGKEWLDAWDLRP